MRKNVCLKSVDLHIFRHPKSKSIIHVEPLVRSSWCSAVKNRGWQKEKIYFCNHLLLHSFCPPAFHLFHPSDRPYHSEIFTLLLLQSDEISFVFQPSGQNKPWQHRHIFKPVLSLFYCILLFSQVFWWAEWTIIHLRPRYFLQRITQAPGNCSNIKSQKVRKCSAATERSGYLSPAKWKSLKLEFGRAVLEWGPRATLLQLMNAEGKPQMFANITTGGNGKQSQTDTGLLRLGQILPVATKHFYIKCKEAVDSYFYHSFLINLSVFFWNL